MSDIKYKQFYEDEFYIKCEDDGMEERRQINRIDYNVKGVIVVCDTEEKIYVDVQNVSPLGMGVLVEKDKAEGLLDKDIIIVADCLVMYANVNRVDEFDDECCIVGISGKTFTPDVLSYLFEHIG